MKTQGDKMATKRELQNQWEGINNALADLADLRVWPVDKDVAEAEGELLAELDELEYEAEQGPQRKRPYRRIGGRAVPGDGPAHAPRVRRAEQAPRARHRSRGRDERGGG